MPQAGSQSDRLAASVEKNVPAKPNSLSTLWSWVSSFKSRTCVANLCLCAGEGGELVTRLQARRAAQSILNRRNKGNKSIHTIKAGVESAQCLTLQTAVRKWNASTPNQNRMLQKYPVKWVNNNYALRLVETFNSCTFLMGTNFWLRQLHSQWSDLQELW